MQQYTVSDSEVIDSVDRLAAAGVTDAAEGGVPTVAIADEVGLTRKAMTRHVSRLSDQGRLEQVWGVGPHGARRGYLPGGDDEQSS